MPQVNDPSPNRVSSGLIENPLTGKISRLVDSAALVFNVNTASVTRRKNVLNMQCLSILAWRTIQRSHRRQWTSVNMPNEQRQTKC